MKYLIQYCLVFLILVRKHCLELAADTRVYINQLDESTLDLHLVKVHELVKDTGLGQDEHHSSVKPIASSLVGPHDLFVGTVELKRAIRDQVRDVIDWNYVAVEVQYTFVLCHIEDHEAVVHAPVNRSGMTHSVVTSLQGRHHVDVFCHRRCVSHQLKNNVCLMPNGVQVPVETHTQFQSRQEVPVLVPDEFH